MVTRCCRHRDDESASALVIALALASIIAILVATISARSVGLVLAASTAHDQLQARTIAEDVLNATLRDLDARSSAGETIPLGSWDGANGSVDLIADETSSPIEVHVDVEREVDDLIVQVDAIVGASMARAISRVRPRSTADVAWLVESRARDPLLQGLPRIACTWPLGDGRRHDECRTMPLPDGPIGGPIHSNDSFAGEVRVPQLPLVSSAAVDDPEVLQRPEVALPRTAGDVLGARPPTCRFRGPTLIRLDGTRMRVTSPLSVPRPGVAEGEVGCLGVELSSLGGVAVIDLPETAVVEVIPDTSDDCVGHPLGLGTGEDLERDWRCDAGDAFVWGRYLGARTIVAHDSIQIVWDVEPGDATRSDVGSPGDVLGLVAVDSVVLRRPFRIDPATDRPAPFDFAGPEIPPFGSYPLDSPSPVAVGWDSPRIVGAVAALRGSFAPQNVGHGAAPTGTIEVRGSIAGRFAPASSWELLDRRLRPIGERRFPITLTYDERLLDHAPPSMPHIDHGRLRIVALEVG